MIWSKWQKKIIIYFTKYKQILIDLCLIAAFFFLLVFHIFLRNTFIWKCQWNMLYHLLWKPDKFLICNHVLYIYFWIFWLLKFLFSFIFQDVSKEFNKCKEEGAKRLDLSKSQVSGLFISVYFIYKHKFFSAIYFLVGVNLYIIVYK